MAQYLDGQEPESYRRVSIGIATVAMILNGLGFSNRRLYLVPQYFEHKPLEHLLGEGIKAEDLNDDCLGRTLDWLYEHDVTRLFAGIARQAREKLRITSRLVHVDTTSFSRRRSLRGKARGRGSDQYYLWLFPRPSRRSQAMDVSIGNDPGI